MSTDSAQVAVPPAASPSSPSPRLTLHIPNAHARVTSPRSSPRLSPAPSDIDAPQHIPPSHATDQQRAVAFALNRASIEESFRQVSAFFYAHDTTGESARDFLARERTFFSWLRLSLLLGVASAALFLRLQLKDLHGVFKSSTQGYSSQRRRVKVRKQVNYKQESYSTQQWEHALHRRAMRLQKRRQEQQRVLDLKQSSTTTEPYISDAPAIQWYNAVTPSSHAAFPAAITLANSLDSTIPSARRSILDTNVVLSKGLGIVFFVLAMVALIVGYADYMICVRALEHADEVIPPPPGVSGANEAGRSGERGGVSERMHDIRHAMRAHSSRVVLLTEIVIAMVIFATALIILITAEEASVAPLPPAFVLRHSLR